MNIDNSYLQERVNKNTSFEIKIGYKPFILKWQSEITDWNPLDEKMNPNRLDGYEQ